jgi:squalene-associated FAD-dependent desaturase
VDRHARGVARVIAVIGGGWAGCAAAVELARGGHRVELHEAAAVVGGRARCVVRDGLPLDNGEHLLLGAYTETLRLAAFLHAGDPSPWIARPLSIRPLARNQRNRLSLRARNLPAPLGLLGGLVGAGGVTWRERVSTMRWFARMRRQQFRCDPSATVAQLVAGLPPRIRDDLWAPLCLAALNTAPSRASAQVFLNILREAFDRTADAALAIVPRAGLDAAVPRRAAEWLAANGHAVCTSSRVRIAAGDDDVVVDDGRRVSRADAAIVAVGPHQLAAAFDAALVEREPAIAAALRDVDAFEWEPITTVYVGYGVEVRLPAGLLRLDDAPGQWAFDRADILERAAPAANRPPLRTLLSVVLSARGAHEHRDHRSLAAAIGDQLRRLLPALSMPCWSQVIAERRATYSCTPALSRPSTGRLAGPIYVAGDYTYAAFPATLEAAVRSGVAAARDVIRDRPPRAT